MGMLMKNYKHTSFVYFNKWYTSSQRLSHSHIPIKFKWMSILNSHTVMKIKFALTNKGNKFPAISEIITLISKAMGGSKIA